VSFTGVHFYLSLALLVACLSFLRGNDVKKTLLLAFSYYFYACWDWRFVFLLFGLTLGNFWLGQRMHSDRGRKTLYMTASLVFSLSILGFFKYCNFFLENINSLAAFLGLESHIGLLSLVLPVGISFYTFQALSYTLDIYRDELEPTDSLRDFCLFVSFFPQLVAGPIVRASFFLPQLENEPVITPRHISDSLYFILRGLLKKLVLADTLARHIVDPAFGSPSELSASFLFAGVVGYSFQVYLDFSAYTDIARGAAKLLGYELPINFDRPYQATSVSNFWQRWHISMSSFFRDYLYFPLGGSKHGNVYFNLILTFSAIGLWRRVDVPGLRYVSRRDSRRRARAPGRRPAQSRHAATTGVRDTPDLYGRGVSAHSFPL